MALYIDSAFLHDIMNVAETLPVVGKDPKDSRAGLSLLGQTKRLVRETGATNTEELSCPFLNSPLSSSHTSHNWWNILLVYSITGFSTGCLVVQS
jgi:hypothetical protein